MRVLGIDFGEKNIGLAVSDKLSLISQAIGQYKAKNKKDDKKYFKALISQYEISKIVIGLPLRMDGSFGIQAFKVKDYAQWLEEELHLPVILWDERLTTKQTLKLFDQHKIKEKKRKELKDQVSAAIILASYLERKRDKRNASQKR